MVGRVLIDCPETGEQVFAGMILDEAAFAAGIADVQRVRCEACGQIHTWSQDDAILEKLTPDQHRFRLRRRLVR